MYYWEIETLSISLIVSVLLLSFIRQKVNDFVIILSHCKSPIRPFPKDPPLANSNDTIDCNELYVECEYTEYNLDYHVNDFNSLDILLIIFSGTLTQCKEV